jgi:agmatine deiminase
MKRLLFFFFLFLSIPSIHSQDILPRYMTAEELRQWPAYVENLRNQQQRVPFPPPENVRTMGEWEEAQALLITWTGFPTILTEIVRNAVDELTVIIVTEDPDQVETVLNFEGIPLDNVEFLEQPFNSIWIRDYGPWAAYQNEVDSLVLIDWIYNRPRPQDDAIPVHVAEMLDLPIYQTIADPYEFVHTGGNHLPDGMDRAFSSDLIFEENPDKDEAAIDGIVQDFNGVNDYIKLPKLPYDGIHHLDMHMRFIDEETIIIGEYPEGVADGPQIEANIQYILNNWLTPFGNPYKIIRIPMPPDQFGRYPDNNGFYRTYTNSIFVNETILVPTYDEQYDTTALRIYEENLPGYNVVGIDCNQIIPSLGALHCITKLVGTNDPLWIAHARLRDTYDTENAFPVTAKIRHKSGIASATLHYRQAPEVAYTAVAMTLTDGENSIWSAEIPAQAGGTEVQYYIEAVANSGKMQVRPIVAPEGYFRFRVNTITAPPSTAFSTLTTETCTATAITFQDQTEGFVESWEWLFPGGTPESSTEQNPTVTYTEPGTYDVTLITGNEIGMDTMVLEAYINILDEGMVPLNEDFEDFASTQWAILNPSDDDAEWVPASSNCDGAVVRIDNFNTDTRGQSDFLQARFNFDGLTDLKLIFDVAYAPYSANFFDGLNVNLIPCEGDPVTVYSKSGATLATAPATESPFIPGSCEDWRTDTIDLSAYADGSYILEFENVGGYGNILWLDNIVFDSPNIPNLAPSVAIITPAENLSFEDELPTLAIEATASDVDGEIVATKLWVNGTEISTDMEAPYTYSFPLPDYGTYMLEVSATDDDGATAFSAPVEIIADQTTGLEEQADQQLRIFPNPVQETLFAELPTFTDMPQVQVFNQLGQAISVPFRLESNLLELDVQALPAATYVLQLTDRDTTYTSRFIINR